jgi:hypothetical protein
MKASIFALQLKISGRTTALKGDPIVSLPAIERHARTDVPAFAAAIVNEPWEAGYEIRHRPEMIPIKGAAAGLLPICSTM